METRKLDDSLPIPLYHQLYEIFFDKIEKGVWVPGCIIPTESELIEYYQVSRTTVREAINLLVQSGYLEKKQGRGTMVCKPRLVENLNKLTGFAEEMERKELVPSAKLVHVDELPANHPVAEKLKISLEDSIILIKRVRLADGEPIAIETSYWPKSIGEHLLKEDLESVAFYKILEQHGVQLLEADEEISAVAATKEDSFLLGVKEQEPLLQMERLTLDNNRNPIEFARTKYRSNRYTYHVHLKR
ncbi:GntR family transcriptional regulator [Ammoniphilus sp. CFH 90114]|uniref:GntR family transcriptional regulator n=1 Tax=Ammoniphilus sp. CFH 90114 TaxID=2493665 RepID=UPI00100F6887|nr:GntR family transcriptional regulator [Ammoniphilus sp. CFH 90114]RXT07025.1 GntR family transcriptional regulator [Ammoniphilus sp. CFH 90114]